MTTKPPKPSDKKPEPFKPPTKPGDGKVDVDDAMIEEPKDDVFEGKP